MFEPDMVRNLIVRMPNWVGDVVMATPALRAMRERWPKAEITTMCLPSGEAILRGSPRIDRFEVYDRRGKDRGPFGRGRVIRRLREAGFDHAVALPNSFSSAWIFKRARIPRRLGTDYGKRGWLLTDRFRPEMEGGRRVPRPMVEHYAGLLESVGVPRGAPDLELFETPEGRSRALERLRLLGVGPGDRILAVNPGASFGPSKLWLPERFAEVADALQRECGLKPVLLGGPGEALILHQIERRMKTPFVTTGDDPFDLDELKTVVRESALMVTTDAGPRHYAVAFGVPVVVLMGPTDPRYTASGLDRTAVLRVEDLECSPCHLKSCPLPHHGCMEWITVEQVLTAGRELLRRFPPPVTEEE
jgi:heptosyltransferase-2